MKVLLVFPPATIYGSDPTVPGATPPLGLAYIAAYLETERHDVRVLDALSLGIDNVIREGARTHVGLTDAEILGQISGFKPDIVGVGAMFTAYSGDAHNVARIVKQYDSRIPVVFGGAHACVNPETVLQDRNVDMVVVGEGEITFSEVVRDLKEGKDLTTIPGTTVRSNGRVVANPPREFIKDLDTLPFPARHLLPMELYFRKNRSAYIMRLPMAQMVTSRGCPQKCIFCSIHSVWRHRWRGRSAGNVVDEIVDLNKKYGVREISFLDDSMATSKKRMHEICDEIIRRRLDIKWTTPNGITHWTLDNELLDKMKESGCYRLTFGIEAGNPGTRKFIRKTHSLEQAAGIIRHANEIGMWTVSTFIIGFPYEDRQSIQDSVRYAIESDTDYALFYLVLPFPGTELYEIYKKEGLLDFGSSYSTSEEEMEKLGAALAHGGVDTKNFKKEELRDLLSQAYQQFWTARFRSFMNPGRILKKIRSFGDIRYVCQLARAGVALRLAHMRHKKFTPQMVHKDYNKCAR